MRLLGGDFTDNFGSGLWRRQHSDLTETGNVVDHAHLMYDFPVAHCHDYDLVERNLLSSGRHGPPLSLLHPPYREVYDDPFIVRDDVLDLFSKSFERRVRALDCLSKLT